MAQLVERLICNQLVGGSSPSAGSLLSNNSLLKLLFIFYRVGFPSGQREQTVNLSANAFGGSNPPPTIQNTKKSCAGVAQLVEHQPSKLTVASSNLVSRSILLRLRFGRWSCSITQKREKLNGHFFAHVAQQVERFLGKEEVHRFKSGRGLQI